MGIAACRGLVTCDESIADGEAVCLMAVDIAAILKVTAIVLSTVQHVLLGLMLEAAEVEMCLPSVLIEELVLVVVGQFGREVPVAELGLGCV